MADTNSQKPVPSLASHDEKSSQITRTTEMYRVNWTTEQHKRLHRDLLSLIEVLYPPE